MKGITISGGDLPPALAEALGITGENQTGECPFRPALLQDVRGLLEGANQPKFQVGDIVRLRAFAAHDFRWPTADDRCIVTQVLDAPHREGESGTSMTAQRNDIALAFIDQRNEAGGSAKLVEFIHDSRRFEKVGSIYDPIVTSDGETLAVA